MAPCAVPDVTTMMIMSTDSDDSIKHVRFSDEAGVVTREHFSKQENQACWYSAKEYIRIGQDRKLTLRRVLLDGEHGKWCMRGLERFRSSRHKLLYKQEQRAVLEAVLYEQARQRALGVSDPDLLAQVAASNSHGATQRAINLARKDRKECGNGWYECGLLFLNQSLQKSADLAMQEELEASVNRSISTSHHQDHLMPVSAA